MSFYMSLRACTGTTVTQKFACVYYAEPPNYANRQTVMSEAPRREASKPDRMVMVTSRYIGTAKNCIAHNRSLYSDLAESGKG